MTDPQPVAERSRPRITTRSVRSAAGIAMSASIIAAAFVYGSYTGPSAMAEVGRSPVPMHVPADFDSRTTCTQAKSHRPPSCGAGASATVARQSGERSPRSAQQTDDDEVGRPRVERGSARSRSLVVNCWGAIEAIVSGHAAEPAHRMVLRTAG
jgi:hypothetical protein